MFNALKRYVEPTIAFLIFAVFVAYLALCCFKMPWDADIHLYVGALRSLYTDFRNPGHETLAISGIYSDLYSPYIVGVAAVGRVIGFTEYRALQSAGVVNIIFYTLSVILFFRAFSMYKRSWIPPAVFLIVSTLLHNQYYHWSSELNLRTISTTQAYPSFLGWAVALMSFVVAERFLNRRELWAAFTLSTLVWFVLLSHPLTASWMMLILGIQGLIALGQGVECSRVIGLYATMLVGIGFTLAWPYMDIISLASTYIDYQKFQPFAGKPFHAMRWMFSLAIASAVYLIIVRRGAFLILGFTSTFLAYLFASQVLRIDFANRYIFFQAFFAQAAVAEAASLSPLIFLSPRLISDLRINAGPLPRALTCGFSIIVLLCAAFAPGMHKAYEAGLIKSPRALVSAGSAHDAYYRRFDDLQGFLGPADVVIASPGGPNEAVAAITGARLIHSPVLAPRAPGYKQRSRDIQIFFSENATRKERQGVIEEYHVTRIVLWGPSLHLTQVIEEQFGRAVLKNEVLAVFAL